MKFADIIAEYDPFHNGHSWQLAQAKACLLYTSPFWPSAGSAAFTGVRAVQPAAVVRRAAAALGQNG